MKALTLAALFLVPGLVAAADAGPLPGEMILPPGQLSPIPANARVVPGYAGTWRQSAAQETVRARILALEQKQPKPCAEPRIVDTVQAAPDLAETRPARIHHALERWTVSACGASRIYEVWYRFEPKASRVAVAESGSGDFQGELDPPYRRLLELAAERSREDAAGKARWLNLPLPQAWTYAGQAGKPGQIWRTDFLPVGERQDAWTHMITVQGFPRGTGAGQARALLEGMHRAREARCGQPAGEIIADDPGRADSPAGDSLLTLLVCPKVPETNYAELSLAKAIEGPDFVYLVQRTWRLPAASADSLRQDSADVLRTGGHFLSLVRLCDAANRRSDCPAPFPR